MHYISFIEKRLMWSILKMLVVKNKEPFLFGHLSCRNIELGVTFNLLQIFLLFFHVTITPRVKIVTIKMNTFFSQISFLHNGIIIIFELCHVLNMCIQILDVCGKLWHWMHGQMPYSSCPPIHTFIVHGCSSLSTSNPSYQSNTKVSALS